MQVGQDLAVCSWDVCVDYLQSLRPATLQPEQWAAMVNETCRAAPGGRAGSSYSAAGGSSRQWEEMLYSWVCLHSMLSADAAAQQQAADSEVGAAGSSGHAAGMDAQGPPHQPAPVPALRPIPHLQQFLLNLCAVESSPEAQLDYIAAFRPATVSVVDWDRRVNEVLWRAAYMVSMVGGWNGPSAAPTFFDGQCILLHSAPSSRSHKDVFAGWACGCLATLAPFIQPLLMVAWGEQGGVRGGAGTSSSEIAAQPCPSAEAGRQLQHELARAEARYHASEAGHRKLRAGGGMLTVMEAAAVGCAEGAATQHGQHLASADLGLGLGSLVSPPQSDHAAQAGSRGSSGTDGSQGDASGVAWSTASGCSYVLVDQAASSASNAAVASVPASDTSQGAAHGQLAVVVSALNALCRGYPGAHSQATYVQAAAASRSAGGSSVAAAAAVVGSGISPIGIPSPSSSSDLKNDVKLQSSCPLWLFHDENSGAVADNGRSNVQRFAGLIKAPAYGITVTGASQPSDRTAAAPAAAAEDDQQALGLQLCNAIRSLQPCGPFIFLGVGVTGSLMAFEAACAMERQHRQSVMLLLLDGPAGLPVHTGAGRQQAAGFDPLPSMLFAAAHAAASQGVAATQERQQQKEALPSDQLAGTSAAAAEPLPNSFALFLAR